ncbi:hypothetical protein CkaCkLH20_13029 [Colletotrichum karsti]|uniref:Uncharacterized protein n=1 Tax=Colletotrichum karsti TaxID=1095194 RepID=A0A9P6LE00_9PEZI|nr:uncharacterized protein CkaCkLH20_13029 [Colletotrichum karsti]KAF9869491.1 hypothetical protein CkaCkLH20_13029 [Colletotrichum karsti]
MDHHTEQRSSNTSAAVSTSASRFPDITFASLLLGQLRPTPFHRETSLMLSPSRPTEACEAVASRPLRIIMQSDKVCLPAKFAPMGNPPPPSPAATFSYSSVWPTQLEGTKAFTSPWDHNKAKIRQIQSRGHRNGNVCKGGDRPIASSTESPFPDQQAFSCTQTVVDDNDGRLPLATPNV